MKIIDPHKRLPALHISHTKKKGVVSASLTVKCGCGCGNTLRIYYPEPDDKDEYVEINGVVGTKDQWRVIFEKLLK